MEKETVCYVLERGLKKKGLRFAEGSTDSEPYLWNYTSADYKGLKVIPFITYVSPPQILDDTGYLPITLVSEKPLLVTPEVEELLLTLNGISILNFYAVHNGQIRLKGVIPFDQQMVQAYFRRQGNPLSDKFIIGLASCNVRFTLNHPYIRQVGEGKLTAGDAIEAYWKRNRELKST